MNSARRNLILNLSLLTWTLVISCLTLEVILRVAKINALSNIEFIPGTGLRRIPGSLYVNKKEGSSIGNYNSHGFRDYERTKAKPAGIERIEILGDSFLEALQVRLDRTVTATLEHLLNSPGGVTRYEVLNLGQSGFGTAEEFLRYEHFGKAFHPDVVVVALFVGNDLRNNSKVLNTESVTYYYTLDPAGQLVLDTSVADRYQADRTLLRRVVQSVNRHSYLSSLISERLFLLRRDRQRREVRASAGRGHEPEQSGALGMFDDVNLFVEAPPAAWQDSWAVTRALLLKFRDTVQADGSRFAVMVIPTAEQIDSEGQARAERAAGRRLDWDRPDAALESFARDHKIALLRLTPIFREAYARTGKPLYGFDGGNHGHWNERGHRLAAESLRSFLESEGLLGRGAGER